MLASNFLNLTNGLEWYGEVENPALVRIESTAIEKGDWIRLLRDLDANFLMSLALGNQCWVYDCGANRKTGKVISDGVPYIRTTLNSIWSGRDHVAFEKEAQEALRKIKYFGRYFQGVVWLKGASKPTEHDGDREYYNSILKKMI